ncbi:MAG: hypothetical protein V1816_05925 [Pseudomonadota bacterium]
MKLMVFADKDNAAADGFLEQMASLDQEVGRRRFTTVMDMMQALREPIAERMVFVFFINKIEELWLLDSRKDLFRSNSILVLLAETTEDALNLSHHLGARFIGNGRTEAETLAIIVSRIL